MPEALGITRAGLGGFEYLVWMRDGPVKLLESPRYRKHFAGLREPVQVIVKVAIQTILMEQGMALATGNWLKYIGDGVWEFRVGKSAKAVYSKGGFPFNSRMPDFLLLIRVFCAFEDNVIVLLGCYDKQRFSGGKRQASAIVSAKNELLTFREGF